MSDSKDESAATGTPEAAVEPTSAEPGFARESIGAYLSAQRRLRGISTLELSQQTRIPLRSLERLEAGSFDAEVDGFVRGFVRTVAESLGLDPDETLNRTLHEPGGAAGGGAPRLSVARVVAAGLGLALLVGLGFGAQWVLASFWKSGGGDGSRSPIVMRRDPVRALAEAQGVAALSPAPALALASRAAEPRLRLPEAVAPPPDGQQGAQGKGRDSQPSSSPPAPAEDERGPAGSAPRGPVDAPGSFAPPAAPDLPASP